MVTDFAPSFRLPTRGVYPVGWCLLLVGGSAGMLAAAFAPVGWWPLAYVALVPMGVLAIRCPSGCRLAWTGFVGMLAWWLIMTSWLMPVSLGGYILLALLQAAYQTGAIVVIWYVSRIYRSAATIAMPLVWVSFEAIRACFPLGGFAWFLIGHSQSSFLPEQSAGRIVQIADVFGEHGVSFVVLMTNGLVVDLLTQSLFERSRHGRTRLRRIMRAALMLWAASMVGSWAYGQYRILQFDQVTQPGLQIAVIQTDVSQDNKIRRTLEQDRTDWARMVELTRAASAGWPGADLFVWPETMVPVPVNPDARASLAQQENGGYGPNAYHRQIQALARELNRPMLVGAPAGERWNGTAGIFEHRANVVHLYYADGVQAPQRYDKIHLVPFGEYLPGIDALPLLKSMFLRYISPYEVDYSLVPGRTRTVFEIRGEPGHPTRIATPICYEDVDAALVRSMVYADGGSKRVDMLVNLTNSAWYPGIAQQPQHLQIATLRSIENRVPTARSVNSGISGFIDSIGRVGPVRGMDRRSVDATGWAAAVVHYDSRRSIFGQVGRVPIMAMVVATALLIVGGWFRHSRLFYQ